MENILKKVKNLIINNNFDYLFHEKTKELWFTGYRDGVKFDVYIRPQRDGKYKFIFEIPSEKKVCLFLNEDDVIKRLDKIFNEGYYFPKKEVEVVWNKLFLI